MHVDDLENIYRKAVSAGARREVQYVCGSTLHRMAALAGHRLVMTTEGHPIVPGETYQISAAGIFRVDV